MPVLSLKQQANLYTAFTSYVLASSLRDARERKFHMQMCNKALMEAKLPRMDELVHSFDMYLFNQEEEESNVKV